LHARMLQGGSVVGGSGDRSAADLARMQTLHRMHGAQFSMDVSTRNVLLEFTMLGDVISAVTEFMVRVLHSRCAIWVYWIRSVACRPFWAKDGHACDQCHFLSGVHCLLLLPP
jgi:hypothetical protein